MKDRIKMIMESQHMTQQTFAQFIQMSPASLSSIFNGRTKPTLTIVEAIKNKIPSLSLEWLLSGTGPMYMDQVNTSDVTEYNESMPPQDGIIDFDSKQDSPTLSLFEQSNMQSVNITPINKSKTEVKIIDKPQRKISEIRVFYDDKTWETFVPQKG
jgi:Predicted transcriptional regulators